MESSRYLASIFVRTGDENDIRCDVTVYKIGTWLVWGKVWLFVRDWEDSQCDQRRDSVMLAVNIYKI